MIQWQYFPKCRNAPPIADTVVAAFESVATAIDSTLYTLESNLVLQACMMHDVQHLGIAVRNVYRQSPDFEKVNRFFDTMYASTRLQLPLKGILVIGY